MDKRFGLVAALWVLVTPAQAAEFMMCAFEDSRGNSFAWRFGTNTWNKDSFGGTFVETAMTKNGRTVSNQRGSRPVWHVAGEDGFTVLVPNTKKQSDFWIGIGKEMHRAGIWDRSDAVLLKDNAIVARGGCGMRAATDDEVKDIGN